MCTSIILEQSADLRITQKQFMCLLEDMLEPSHRLHGLLPKKLNDIRERETRRNGEKIYNFFTTLNVLYIDIDISKPNIYRGYYTAVRRYQFYLLVVKTIFHE